MVGSGGEHMTNSPATFSSHMGQETITALLSKLCRSYRAEWCLRGRDWGYKMSLRDLGELELLLVIGSSVKQIKNN